MKRFFSFLFLIVGSGGLFSAGYIGFLQIQSRILPVQMDLWELEEGNAPLHCDLRFDSVIANYAMGTASLIRSNDENKVKYVYYPVVSKRHSEYDRIRFAAMHHGGYEKIPGIRDYKFYNFSVIIRDFSVHSLNALPKKVDMTAIPSAQFFGTAHDLPLQDQSMLFNAYKGINLDRIYILDINKPFLGAGWILLSLTISGIFFSVILILNSKIKKEPRKQIYSGLGLRNPFAKGTS